MLGGCGAFAESICQTDELFAAGGMTVIGDRAYRHGANNGRYFTNLLCSMSAIFSAVCGNVWQSFLIESFDQQPIVSDPFGKSRIATT
jgi:hypothetical protein